MNSIIQYFIEANLCLAVLGLGYLVLLRKELDFNFRRSYILLSAVIILLSPLIKLPNLTGGGINLMGEMETLFLPELVIGIGNAAISQYDNFLIIGKVAGLIYVGIAALFALNFLFQLTQIGWFYKSFNRKRTKIKGYTIIETNGVLPTFSFFRVIFFDNSINLNHEEKNRIIDHEIVHIRQFHSLDIVLTEIIKIIFWYNPLAWYFKNEAQELHEFLADREIIKNTDRENYNSLLAKMTLTKAHLSLGHHFNKSKTLKRIAMMKFENRSVNQWKRAFIIPLVMFTVVVISCNDEVMKDMNTVMETASQKEVPVDLQPKLQELQREFPNAELVYIETSGNSKKALENLQDLDPKSIAYMNVYKEEEKIGILFDKSGNFQKLRSQNNAGQNEVFTLVDVAAMPEGGYDAFYDRIASKLKYPSKAKEAGVEGKVFIQFIVEKNGDLSEATVLKGIGHGCDQAALDAITHDGKWSGPTQNGIPVRQRIVLPITFSL